MIKFFFRGTPFLGFVNFYFSYQEKYSSRDQVRQILLSVKKRDISSYQTFRQALMDTNQKHVVDRFLPEMQTTQPEPEIQNTQQDSKSKATKVIDITLFGLKHYVWMQCKDLLKVAL